MSTESTTLSKLATQIAAHLGKELDEPFKRMLADKIDSWRSRLIQDSLQEKPLESKYFRQTVWVPLEEVSPVPDCIKAPVCKVLQSIKEIPVPMRYGPRMFDFVGSVDGSFAFTEGSPGTTAFLQAGKYSKHKIFWEQINGFIQIKSTKGLPAFRLDGVFDKPSEAMRFNCEVSAIGCDYWNEPYPITGKMAQQVVQYILQVDFNRPVTPATKEVDVNPQKQNHEPDGR